MKRRLTRIAGFTLLPVILTMTLIAAIAFLLNRDNGMNAEMVAGQSDADRARYAAEAGLQAVNANMQDNDCSGFYYNILTPLTNSNFGGASYTAYANPGFGWPVTLYSTGTYNGTSVTLSRSNVKVYKTTPDTYTLQPNAAAGIDSYIVANNVINKGIINNLSIKTLVDYPLLQFDFSMFPAQSLPTTATISLYPSSVSAGTNAVSMHRLTNSWAEGDGITGVNWTTRDGTQAWSTPGGDYHPVAVAAVPNTLDNVWSNFNVTDLATAWMLGRYPNYGVTLAADPLAGNFKYDSSDSNNSTLRPKIIFNYLLPCGTTGPTACTAGNIRDDFSTIAYTGNNGSVNWSSNWTETGEADGASTGKLSVINAAQCASGNCLKLRNDTATVMRITRGANLSSAVSATLKFNYRRTMVAGSGGNIRLEISKDGGTNFTLLKSYPLTVTDSAQIAENIDISAYIAANTQIRFSTDGSNIQTNIHIDNIEIITSCSPPPTTVTLNPVADSYIYIQSATINFGATTSFSIKYVAAGDQMRSLLKFDLSSIPAGTVIQSAKLRIDVTSVLTPSANPKAISAYALTQAWTENLVSWNKKDAANWTTLGGTYRTPSVAMAVQETSGTSPPPGTFTTGWLYWDLKALTQEWVDGITANNGVLLISTVRDEFRAASKENATLANRPQLVITY